mmetsp:Transcript_7601/g.15194  ORF Transcript_7601/g.15194 Transcript_7601/m.15194 type:complete len:231 (+) Transcript_7601:206-898(+)
MMRSRNLESSAGLCAPRAACRPLLHAHHARLPVPMPCAAAALGGGVILDDHDVRGALLGDRLRHRAQVDLLVEVAQLHRPHHHDVRHLQRLEQRVLERGLRLLLDPVEVRVQVLVVRLCLRAIRLVVLPHHRQIMRFMPYPLVRVHVRRRQVVARAVAAHLEPHVEGLPREVRPVDAHRDVQPVPTLRAAAPALCLQRPIASSQRYRLIFLPVQGLGLAANEEHGHLDPI